MEMRKVRGSAAIATAVLLAAGTVGCAGGPTGGQGGGGGGDVTLTISRWAGPHADAQVEILKEYTEETGVEVRIDGIDYAQLQQKQTLNMTGKTGEYDLIYVPENWFRQYEAAGYLLPLSDKVDAEELADFNPVAIEIASDDEGNVYGLPDLVQTFATTYNKEILEAEGLEAPETWDEILAVAKHFKDQGTGIALPFRQGGSILDLLNTFTHSAGGSLFTSDGKLDITSPEAVEAAAFMKELAKYAVEGSMGWHVDETTKAIQFGQAPIAFCISGLFSVAEDPAESTVAGKLGYAPLPHKEGNDPVGYLSFWSYSVPQDSKHQEEAVALAEWLTSTEVQKKMALAFPGHLSLRQSLEGDTELAEVQPWADVTAAGLSNAVPPPLQENAPKLYEAAGAALNGMIVNDEDPEAVLQRLQDKFVDQF
jgi:multiple sugar transport system substrate-binding protein